MKICPKCHKQRRLTSFYYRKRGPRAGEYYEKCKECMKLRGRSYYHLNRDRQLRLALIRRAQYRSSTKAYLVKVKNKPCSDCGRKFPHYVMDFDHRDARTKHRDIARMVAGGWAMWKIEREIEKCDLVCANCHRIRTYGKHAGIAKVVTARV